MVLETPGCCFLRHACFVAFHGKGTPFWLILGREGLKEPRLAGKGIKKFKARFILGWILEFRKLTQSEV